MIRMYIEKRTLLLGVDIPLRVLSMLQQVFRLEAQESFLALRCARNENGGRSVFYIHIV